MIFPETRKIKTQFQLCSSISKPTFNFFSKYSTNVKNLPTSSKFNFSCIWWVATSDLLIRCRSSIWWMEKLTTKKTVWLLTFWFSTFFVHLKCFPKSFLISFLNHTILWKFFFANLSKFYLTEFYLLPSVMCLLGLLWMETKNKNISGWLKKMEI